MDSDSTWVATRPIHTALSDQASTADTCRHSHCLSARACEEMFNEGTPSPRLPGLDLFVPLRKGGSVGPGPPCGPAPPGSHRPAFVSSGGRAGGRACRTSAASRGGGRGASGESWDGKVGKGKGLVAQRAVPTQPQPG